MSAKGKLTDSFFKKNDINKLKRLKVTSSQISDALNNLTGNSGVINGVKPLFDTKIVGMVITAKTRADDWGTSVKAIDVAGKNEVIFILVDDDRSAVWGELTSMTAKEKGIAGTVIYGAVRDVGAVRKMEYPVFYKNIVPNAGSSSAQGQINVSIKCGDISIDPQDVVVADDCGVVVIPKELLSSVINEANNIKKKEKQIVSKIEMGNSLSSILKLK